MVYSHSSSFDAHRPRLIPKLIYCQGMHASYLQLINRILALAQDLRDKVVLDLDETLQDLGPDLGRAAVGVQHVAPGLGLLRGHLRHGARVAAGLGGHGGEVVGELVERDVAAAHVVVERGAQEGLVHRDGLVGGDLVAGLEHAGEGVVTDLARQAGEAVAGEEDVIARLGEFVGARVGDGKTGSLTTHPVTGVVAVTIKKMHLDSAVKQVTNGIEEATVDNIQGAGEVASDSGRDCRIVDGRADGLENLGLGQVAVDVRGREGVVLGRGNIEPALVQSHVSVNRGVLAPRLDEAAELSNVDLALVNGGNIKALEFILASLDLVLAAVGLGPVVLELRVQFIREDLQAISLLYVSICVRLFSSKALTLL